IGETWLNYLVERRSILWWGGNGNSTEHTAWLNLKRGIAAPASGSIAVNGHAVAEQIGAQIFIDGWAIVAPGNPALAARLAEQAARVSHDGAAVDAAKLWAAMEAEAFVCRDVERLIEVGLAQVAPDGPIARLIADIRDWRKRYPDWREAREAIEARYGYDKHPGHCHVIPNHALMIMALLYAPDDFARAQTIVCTSGWDTDCNAGNVGCLMGIMLGLEGIDVQGKWRGPLADRMLISSADGGDAINDAVRVSARLVDIGRKLAGAPPLLPPKAGAQFHFSQPGSVQGFAAVEGAGVKAELANIAFEARRALELRFAGLGPDPAFIVTPTFTPPEVTRMRTYELMATPLVYPGQRVQARIIAGAKNAGAVRVSLSALVYGVGDSLAPRSSEAVVLAPNEEAVLDWRLPDTDGQPIQSLGVAAMSPTGPQDATVILDWLRWDGPPDARLRRPREPNDFWRRAWVNAADNFSTTFSQAFRVSQDRGQGMIIHGGRQWRDYRVETALTAHLAEHIGVGVRVQGLRRFYAVLLERPDKLLLVRVRDGETTLLAETAFPWSFEMPHLFVVEADGRTISAAVDGVRLSARDDSEEALANGGAAIIIQGGAVSTDEVIVGPIQGSLGQPAASVTAARS
ncbi:MAG: ADP-ribosylglycohydrolase family protein, partial [Hyphomicrobiales bacterium]|nr:ADP-ribosylglycohydrolase family protein [Hyphomicrobiales bacterium]